jgi:hypothetical protein
MFEGQPHHPRRFGQPTDHEIQLARFQLAQQVVVGAIHDPNGRADALGAAGQDGARHDHGGCIGQYAGINLAAPALA